MTSDFAGDRWHRHHAVRKVAAGIACLALLVGCGGDTDDASAGQITVPPDGTINQPVATLEPPGDEVEPPNDTTTVPTVTAPATVALDRSYFGEPAEQAIESIERLGIFVAAFAVCSGSVREGEVRQITTGDGVILDDRDGLTEAAQFIQLEAVLQMKVGTGVPCD